MNTAQINLAHRTVAELEMYARASEQYGHAPMASAMRIAANLLQLMVDEAEAKTKADADG